MENKTLYFNEDQYCVADELLKFLYECGGTAMSDDYYDHLMKKCNKPYDLYSIFPILNELDLIEIVNEEQVTVRLKKKGYEAAKMGLDKYFEAVSESEIREKQIQELTIKELRGNIFHVSKWWVILLINAVITFLIAYLLMLIESK